MVKYLRLATGLIALFFISSTSFAQQRTISGTVTDAQNGDPLPGVNVVVSGTTTGTSTGAEGHYELSVPSGADTLAFSFIGYKERKEAINKRSVINVKLKPSVKNLNDVVVTAFGVKQKKRRVGYSVQEVQSKDIENAKQENLVNALDGKISGVRISSTGGAPGQSSRIVIRGITSLDPGADNQPLFVVDGVPISNSTMPGVQGSGAFTFSNGVADINPEDIKSVSVLKGPAASALYGIRAANGAVVIETKGGQSGETRASFSSSVGFEKISKFPDLQKQYMAGWYGDPNYKSYPFPFHAWGPKADTVADARFYDNNRNYFGFDGPGRKIENNLTVSGGSDKSTFYVSASNLNHKGVAPNSQWDRSTVKVSGSVDFTDNLTVKASANYAKSNATRLPVDAQLGQLIYYPTSIDVTHYKKPDGTMYSYTPWLDNPLYVAYNHNMKADKDRLIGNVSLDYNIADWATITYRLGSDLTNDIRKEVLPGPQGIEGELALSSLGMIQRSTLTNREITSTLRVNFDRQITKDLHASLSVGNDIFDSKYNRLTATGTDFGVPNFYDLSNTSQVSTSENQQQKRIVGAYGDLKVDYRDMLYLNVTGRNDWSSTLPKDNRSFFYPSASLGFVFSDALNLPDFMTYGKLRASWAQVGKDAPAYATGITYGSQKFAGQTMVSKNDQLGDPNLKPEMTTSVEFGLDLRFLNNRLGIDATWYKSNSKDQIIPVPISNVTGYTKFLTNAGEIQNKGIELTVKATPVQNDNFQWDINTNFTKNKNSVVSIKQGIKTITLFGSSYSYGGRLIEQLRAGYPYGNILGTSYKRYYANPADEDPVKINTDHPILIGSDGFPERNTTYRIIGNATPDWTAGITNTFSYKNVSLSFLVDIKKGGDLYNQPAAFYAAQGTLPITVHRDETKVFNGVLADGTKNTKEVYLGQGMHNGVDYGDGYYRNVYRKVASNFVEDASWVRLRNLSISYSLPHKWVDGTLLRSASITFTGNNLWLYTPYSGFDPESSQFGAGSNTQGFQGLRTPATKSYTLGIDLKF
ncbi:MAG TPA: SusC/RagA family TonB-linked outer membrane protein [Balneolaceae bacterium]|nr:SusC/RagA family TonB-linked outer membrane protein [Balneolaceae bacterium]